MIREACQPHNREKGVTEGDPFFAACLQRAYSIGGGVSNVIISANASNSFCL